MLGKLSFSERKTFGENVAKNLIVKPIIGTKYHLGLGKKKKKKKNAGKKSKLMNYINLLKESFQDDL